MAKTRYYLLPLLFFCASCISVWPKDKQSALLEHCNLSGPFADKKQNAVYCKCYLDVAMKKYASEEDFRKSKNLIKETELKHCVRKAMTEVK